MTNQVIGLALSALTLFVLVYVATRAYQRAKARG